MWCDSATPLDTPSLRFARQDPDYLSEFGPLALGVTVFCFIWFFIMPYVHRFLERVRRARP